MLRRPLQRTVVIVGILLAAGIIYPYPYTLPPHSTHASNGGQTYYVDSQVDQSGDGTSWSTAWKTIAEATHADLTPGTTVLIQPGTYHEDMGITSNGAEIVPLTTGVVATQTNRVVFPAGTDLSGIDLETTPGSYYLYLLRSWKSNNGVFQITSVNPTQRFVEVDGTLLDERGTAGDTTQLSAAIGQPIIYRNASDTPDTERVVLDASTNPDIYTLLYIGDYIDPYHANPANYNIVDGFDLTGSQQGGGVHIQNSSFNVVMNGTIFDQQGAGVLINGHEEIPAQYNMVIQNTIWNTPAEGIYIGAGSQGRAQNHTHFTHVVGNVIETRGNAANAQLENAIDVKEYNTGTVVEGNTIQHAELLSGGNGMLDIRNESHNTLVYGNTFRNIRSGGNETEYVVNIYPETHGVALYNNIIFNDTPATDGVFAINVHADQTQDILIAHNTVYHTGAGVLLQYSTPDGDGSDNGVTIANNIFAPSGDTMLEEWTWDGATEGTFSLHHNLFASDPGLDTYPVDPASVGDAVFVQADSGDFHLTENSTRTRDRGTLLQPALSIDFDGTMRDDGQPDLGAFEYVPNQGEPEPTPEPQSTFYVPLITR